MWTPASWSNGNAFVSRAGGRRFISRTGQIENRVANGSPPQRHFLKEAVLPAGAMSWRWAPPTRYKLRRNTESVMKELQACPWEWDYHWKCPMGWDGTGMNCCGMGWDGKTCLMDKPKDLIWLRNVNTHLLVICQRATSRLEKPENTLAAKLQLSQKCHKPTHFFLTKLSKL